MKSVEEMLAYVREELRTLREQGCDTWEMEREAALIRHDGGPDAPQRARGLCERLGLTEPAPEWPYVEPDDLDAIRAQRPDGPRAIAAPLPKEVARDKILGAWLGRAAGCMLGKPVDGWGRARVLDLLNSVGGYPPEDYLPPAPGQGADGAFAADSPLLRGNVRCAVQDDALDATVLALRALEAHGPSLTSGDVANLWTGLVPYGRTQAAERAAYRNLVAGLTPPQSAEHQNPWRESVGAMMRADLWGYVSPGRPQRAAELAFRDGRVTHARNGLYAAMWLAATVAAAFVAHGPEQAVEIGLSEVPAGCRLAEAVGNVIKWRREDDSPETTMQRVLGALGAYDERHAIPNAAIVAAAVAWSGKDFSRAIGQAVCGGLATAANSAAVGSVCAAMVGCAGIDQRWTAPLNDRIETGIPGEVGGAISDLAQRTAAAGAMFDPTDEAA